jgi:DNA-binding GntR family transcriptional regulator
VHLYAHLVGDDLSRSVEEHEAIVQRIANGNPDAASRAVQRNWRNAAARMQRLITLKGERGTW